jgi:hypothetical protein
MRNTYIRHIRTINKHISVEARCRKGTVVWYNSVVLIKPFFAEHTKSRTDHKAAGKIWWGGHANNCFAIWGVCETIGQFGNCHNFGQPCAFLTLVRLASLLARERKLIHTLLSLKNFTYSSGHYTFILMTVCANESSPCMSSPPSPCRSSFYSGTSVTFKAKNSVGKGKLKSPQDGDLAKALRLLRFGDVALTYI